MGGSDDAQTTQLTLSDAKALRAAEATARTST